MSRPNGRLQTLITVRLLIREADDTIGVQFLHKMLHLGLGWVLFEGPHHRQKFPTVDIAATVFVKQLERLSEF